MFPVHSVLKVLTKGNIVLYDNKYIDINDFSTIQFRIVLDDINYFLHVPGGKRTSQRHSHGTSLIEPAVFESYKHWDNPWAISNANLKQGMKVLDCGSGRGVLQFYLASKGVEVHAVDISHNRSKLFKKIQQVLRNINIRYEPDPYIVHRKLNRKYHVNVRFKHESAESLSFPDNFFDRVFCISVIEHMGNGVLIRSIQEIERVLKPGGLLLLTFDFHPLPDPTIIGFTGIEFRKKVIENCSLKIAQNEPDFTIENWDAYIREINAFFSTHNPNTSFGVVFEKSYK